MKPIEPGCMALVVRAQPPFAGAIGKTVMVGNISEDYGPAPCIFCEADHDWWFITPVENAFIACGCCLMRIDGYQETEKVQGLQRPVHP